MTDPMAPQVEVIYRNGHVSDFVVAEDLLQRLMDREKGNHSDASKIQVQDVSLHIIYRQFDYIYILYPLVCGQCCFIRRLWILGDLTILAWAILEATESTDL